MISQTTIIWFDGGWHFETVDTYDISDGETEPESLDAWDARIRECEVNGLPWLSIPGVVTPDLWNDGFLRLVAQPDSWNDGNYAPSK